MAVPNELSHPAGGVLERRSSTPAAPAVGDVPLRLLLDELQDHGIFMLSRTGMVLTWNAGAEIVHGYPADEIIGQHYSRLFPAEAQPEADPAAQLQAARVQGGLHREGWQVRKDGSRFWASQVLTPLHDRTGRLRGFGVMTQVLTDRMRAQDLLAVLDAAPDGVLGVDAGGSIMFTNQAAARIFGYPRPDLVGRPIEELVPERFRARHAGWRASYTGAPVRRPMGGGLELSALRHDGSEFPAEVSLSWVDTSRGRVVTALVRDLSEQRAADAARRLADERLQALFEHSPAGQVEALLDGGLVRVNSTLERMLRCGRDELVGRSWWDLVHPQDRVGLVGELQTLRRGEPAGRVGASRLIGQDGTIVPVLISAAVLRDRQGVPQRLLWMAIDRR